MNVITVRLYFIQTDVSKFQTHKTNKIKLREKERY